MDYYNVSLHSFFYELFSFLFPKWSLWILFFLYWASWEFCFVDFFFKTLWIVTMFPHMVFVLLQCFLTCFFFNYLCWFFFNIKLVENLALTFPTCFFFSFFHFVFTFFFQNCLLFFIFLFFFSELFLLILFF